MSVDTRAHIESAAMQERAVLKRIKVWGGAPYTARKAVSVRGHAGDDIRITLDDLGTALRVLKVSAADLGYTLRGSDAGRAVDRNRKATP